MIRTFCDGCDALLGDHSSTRWSREIRADHCGIRLRVSHAINGVHESGTLCENCWAAALITMAEQIVADKKERDDRVQA